MSRDYILEYEKLLKETLRGAGVRAFAFGYNSKTLDRYLKAQKSKIHAITEEAHNARQEIYTRQNMNLESRLFGLEVKVMWA